MFIIQFSCVFIYDLWLWLYFFFGIDFAFGWWVYMFFCCLLCCNIYWWFLSLLLRYVGYIFGNYRLLNGHDSLLSSSCYGYFLAGRVSCFLNFSSRTRSILLETSWNLTDFCCFILTKQIFSCWFFFMIRFLLLMISCNRCFSLNMESIVLYEVYEVYLSFCLDTKTSAFDLCRS